MAVLQSHQSLTPKDTLCGEAHVHKQHLTKWCYSLLVVPKSDILNKASASPGIFESLTLMSLRQFWALFII